MKKQESGLKRNCIDKYYTKETITHLCSDLIRAKIEFDNDDIIIEPSAGNGSFIDVIKKMCKNYLFYDISPEDNTEITEMDYLKWDHSIIEKYNRKHIIGNPPFGRQSSVALKFIKKSTSFCDTISFILPKSFKKESLKNKIPLSFHCIHESDLPKNSFLLNGKEYDVPCIFQIWEKRDYHREKSEKLIENGYKFVKKNENPDISFRRVGVYAGKIDKNIEKSEQSHYFIKFNDEIDIDAAIEKINKIEFQCKTNTVGPKSISKQELIKEFNNVL